MSEFVRPIANGLRVGLICFLSVARISASAKSSADTKANGDTSAWGISNLEDLKLVEGDEPGNEVKSLKAELMVSHAEQKAIRQILKLIVRHKGSALEPELYFRLAELYMRTSKTDRFFEIHRESETVVRIAPRMVSQASSKESVRKAVEAYSKIQNSFSDFPQMDLVLFNHAFARQVLGENKVAEGIYWDLIKKYSDSPLVADSHLAIGEIAFEAGQYPMALEHFNAIRKFPESRVYPYGLYKAAWTHYNIRNTEKALKSLEEVVSYGKFVEQNHIDARLDLRKEALSDMPLFYEDVYPSKDAYKYFREQAGEVEVGSTLLKLGSLYERHSRFQDQQTVLDRFITEMPESSLLPQVHTDLILANDHLRKKDEAVARMEEFVKLCEPDSRWMKAHVAEKEKTTGKGINKTMNINTSAVFDNENDCGKKLSEIALREAQRWLRAWRKLPSDTSFADAAEKAFEIYLRSPARGEEYAQARYAYADMLFARRKFRRASVEYAALGSGASDNDNAKLSHDASYGALLSLEKAVADKWSNDDEKIFHQLAQEYLTKYPKGQYRLDIEYKMALLAYEKERYSEAEPIFLRLGHDYPNLEKGQKAQDLYLDILNIRKDYHGIRNYAQTLMRSKSPAASAPSNATLAVDGKAREQKMRRLYEQSYFLEIQSLEEKGDLNGALKEYITFNSQNARSEYCEKATWNMMLLHFKLGDPLSGAKTAEDFATKFPNSPQAINALLRASQTFEQMAQLGDAARTLEKLAIQDSKSNRRWKELAADFHALSGQFSLARALYTDLKAGANEAQTAALYAKMLTFEKNYGDERTQAEVEKAMVDRGIQPQTGESKVAVVERLYREGDATMAFNEARRHLGGNLTNNQKARLRLVQAKILEAEFLKASVKSRAERIATVLAIKTEKLQKAQEAFQSAIKFGDARVSLEAFEHLYNCYASYVTALKDMPIPSGLSVEDGKAFREEVSRLVIPLEEKSVDTLAQAVTFARQQQFLDGSVPRLEKQLNRLNQSEELSLQVGKPGIALPILPEGPRVGT